jgi:hypothetical protein
MFPKRALRNLWVVGSELVITGMDLDWNTRRFADGIGMDLDWNTRWFADGIGMDLDWNTCRFADGSGMDLDLNTRRFADGIGMDLDWNTRQTPKSLNLKIKRRGADLLAERVLGCPESSTRRVGPTQ